MKQIPLTHGKYAIVDERDYYQLIKYKWVAISLYSNKFYARNQKHGLMHKMLLKEDPNETFTVSFKNGNTLDCRRENMVKENSKISNSNFEVIKKDQQLGLFTGDGVGSAKTAQIISKNVSGVVQKIVFEAKYISPEGRTFHFGTYDTKEEAQENYDKMIKMIPM